ncbi:hypothetical protein [Polaromonas sp. CG9_12]|nr:hypothetical protein [Polaromonas sp. CG9_12]
MIKRAGFSLDAGRTRRRRLGSAFGSVLGDEPCLFLYEKGCWRMMHKHKKLFY